MSFSQGRELKEVQESKTESKDVSQKLSVAVRRLNLSNTLAEISLMLCGESLSPRSEEKFVTDLQANLDQAKKALQTRVKASADSNSDVAPSPGDSKRSVPAVVLTDKEMSARLLEWNCPEIEVKKLGTDGYLSVRETYELVKECRDNYPEFISDMLKSKKLDRVFRCALTPEDRKASDDDVYLSLAQAVELGNVRYVKDALKTHRSVMAMVWLKSARTIPMMKLLVEELIKEPWNLEYAETNRDISEFCINLLRKNCYEEFKAVLAIAKTTKWSDFGIQCFEELCRENNIAMVKRLQEDGYDVCLDQDTDYSCITSAASTANMEFFQLFYSRLVFPVTADQIKNFKNLLMGAACLSEIKGDLTPQQIAHSEKMVKSLVSFITKDSRFKQVAVSLRGYIHQHVFETKDLCHAPGLKLLFKEMGLGELDLLTVIRLDGSTYCEPLRQTRPVR